MLLMVEKGIRKRNVPKVYMICIFVYLICLKKLKLTNASSFYDNKTILFI